MKSNDYSTCPKIVSGEEMSHLRIPRERIFDLVPHAMFGLLDDLIPGSELANNFLIEFEKFQNPDYGVWVYYPGKEHLVRFAPPFWHRLSLVVRNSTLLMDPEMKTDWLGVRAKLENAVVAVAGCSVGNNVAHAVAFDLRPLKMKIADHKDYHLNNANRVRLTYGDFGRNKAIVTAEQIHSVDPFMDIDVFSEGIHQGNVNDFVDGSSIIIEETDDPEAKIFIRERARKAGIPVVMVSDLGSAVQLDIRRFDFDNKLPLAACGVLDDELYGKRDTWRSDLADRNKFYEFAFCLIGKNYIHVPEFKRIVFKEAEPVFAGVPQLGSTAMAAGGIAGEAVARLLLGHQLPERMFIQKHSGKIFIQ